jgi:adenylate cyclase
MINPPDNLSPANARILVVDDQQAYVLLLERMLRGAGYTCIESTTDPKAVCELHRSNRYDLILLDLQMPGMDGFKVMEGLREIETVGHLPVLVLTAQPEHKLRAMNAGAKDFVSKPFDLAEVLVRVHNMLEVRLLQLETAKLRDLLAAEQKITGHLRAERERWMRELLPRAIAGRFSEYPGVTVEAVMEVIESAARSEA